MFQKNRGYREKRGPESQWETVYYTVTKVFNSKKTKNKK